MMNLSVNVEEFNLLRDLIRNECGIEIQDNKAYLIESRLAQLVIESGSNSFLEFYQKARQNVDTRLREKIVDAITTNETLWFRDQFPYQTLSEVLFPNLFQKLASGKIPEIRIWSAACSTGQEPYSIAMLADQFAERNGYGFLLKKGKLKILGTDISNSALFLARLGRYDQLAMSRGMPLELYEKYFTSQNNVSILSDKIKKMVTLQKFNIMDTFDSLGSFHVVFLRNVAIYFSEPVKRELLYKISKSLAPEGHLFLGASESFLNYQDTYTACNHARCYYYQRKD